MTNEEKARIDAMSQMEMAEKLRFTPVGRWPFNEVEAGEYFMKVFRDKGGMTPTISKAIGW